MDENGQWIASSLRVDDAALTDVSGLVAGKLDALFDSVQA
jgi:hypothetical protein